jgi:hypothetical protein
MAIPSLGNYTQYIGRGVVQGYTSIIPPFMVQSRQATGPGGTPITTAGLNDNVRVGLATGTSASIDVTYTGGYGNQNNGNIPFKIATMNIWKAQPLFVTDTEALQIGEEGLVAEGQLLGLKLAADVLSASWAPTISTANFPTHAANSASAFTSSANAAFADLQKKANDNNWPTERYLVANTTLWQNFMLNSGITAASNFGFNAQVAQTGQLNSVFGFKPYYTTLTLPNVDNGFACTRNAMVLTTLWAKPQDGSNRVVNDAFAIQDDVNGITLGYYEYYEPNTRTLRKYFDALAGVTTLDSNALIHIK